MNAGLSLSMQGAAAAMATALIGCTAMPSSVDTTISAHSVYESGEPTNPGFRYEEAAQFIEFCVELDNQDDRFGYEKAPSSKVDPRVWQPAIDPILWNPVPIFDSRSALGSDVVKYQETGAPQDDGWHKLYDSIIARVTQGGATASVDAIRKNPAVNGFGPYQNAWLLYEGRERNANSYAIAIRGTVFAAEPSAMEDAIFQPVHATSFLSEYVRFSNSAAATLHSGFVHATFTLLLDERYGILPVIHKMVPTGARLYIVGHSQGAAMATLVHAFLHYGLQPDNPAGGVFGLAGREYKLKSYGFAQPKVGNYSFSASFASITQRTDSAIVINNDLDPVPKVPLTLQSIADVDYGFDGSSVGVKVLHWVSSIAAVVRGVVGVVGEPIVRKNAAGYSYFYNYPVLKLTGKDRAGFSWEFLPAGHVIMVFGAPGDPKDDFYQHHATTYRELIKLQLRDFPQEAMDVGVGKGAGRSAAHAVTTE